MATQVVRVQSFTQGSLGGIGREAERGKVTHRNADINSKYSNHNEYFKRTDCGFYNAWTDIKTSLNVQGKATKKSIAFEGMVITANKAFFAEQFNWKQGNPMSTDMREFFQRNYDWAVKEIGYLQTDKNIISAVVHLDEITPHLQLYYLPITEKWQQKVYAKDANGHVLRRKTGSPIQAKNKDGKTIYKSVIDKQHPKLARSEFWRVRGGQKSYSRLQDSYNATVGRLYNLERGEIGSNADHRTKNQWEQDQLNKQKADLEREIEPLQDLQKDIDAVDAKGIQLPFGFNLLSKPVLEQFKEHEAKYIANRPKLLELDEREQNIQQREQELSVQHEQLRQQSNGLKHTEQFLEAKAKQLDEKEQKLTLKEANLTETAIVQQKQTEIENLRDKVYTLTKELEQIKENQKTSIKIPLGITEIEPYAFANHTHLKEIKIPDSVTKIGAGAFANCKNLEEIFFSVNTEKIGAGAFYGCEKLSLVQLPITAKYEDNTFPFMTHVAPYTPAQYYQSQEAEQDQMTEGYGWSM